MTAHAVVVSDMEADVRWREWQARGIANDRRTAAGMRRALLLIVAAVVVWVVVQLV